MLRHYLAGCSRFNFYSALLKLYNTYSQKKATFAGRTLIQYVEITLPVSVRS